MKRLACGLLALSALTFHPAAGSAQSTPRPAKVHVVAESGGDIQRTYPAIILPSQEVEMSFQVGGRVIELPIRGAMDVAEGDVLARLDPSDFEAQIAQLESQRDQSTAQLKALRTGARSEEIAALEAAVASAQAQVDQAQDQAERTRELVERGVAASARQEQDEASLRVAQANLIAQQEQLVIGQSGGRAEDIEAAEAVLRGLEAQLQVARDNLDDATLRAPFEGIIARRDIENFTNIQPGQSVALLQALSTIHLAFDVPGPDVTDLSSRGGPEAIRTQVTFDALPGKLFDADVVEFSLQADRSTQTYRGRVAAQQPGTLQLLPGMVGRVVVSAPGDAPILTVPLTAVTANSDGSPVVWKVGSDNTVSKQPVTLGDARGDHVVIADGLSAGDTVVSAGVNKLMDGTEIRPVTKIGG